MTKPDEIDEEVAKFFAKMDYSPDKVEHLGELVENVRGFLQYIGTNQYYGDSVNKKVFFLTLESDYCLISLDRLSLRSGDFSDTVKRALILKKEPLVNDKDFDVFRKELATLEEKITVLCDEAKTLIVKIKEDASKYDYKHPTGWLLLVSASSGFVFGKRVVSCLFGLEAGSLR